MNLLKTLSNRIKFTDIKYKYPIHVYRPEYPEIVMDNIVHRNIYTIVDKNIKNNLLLHMVERIGDRVRYDFIKRFTITLNQLETTYELL